MTASGLWRIALTIPGPVVAQFEAAVAPFCEAVGSTEVGEDWRIDGVAAAPPDRARLDVALALAAAAVALPVPAATIEPLPDVDWVARVHEQLPAVIVDRFCIHGSHIGEGAARDRISLRIDASLAFGTGHHASTAGCLAALSRCRTPPAGPALDLGCGSGVLAIAIAKLWRLPVTAVDVDPRAVEETQANAKRNGVAPLIKARAADGVSAEVRRDAPFGLIVANILARPLRRMAGDIVGCLDRPGTVILAGFLDEHAGAVLAAYAARGLTLSRRIRDGGWTTLVLRR
jgi:ribosomal protein L11 methyltransferase